MTAPPDEPEDLGPAAGSPPSSESPDDAPTAPAAGRGDEAGQEGSWARVEAAGKVAVGILPHTLVGDLLRGMFPSRLDPGKDAPADSPAVEEKAADRLITFSDAVVAIAITLLALQLPVPDVNGASIHQYLTVIGRHWEEYAAFLISFVVIANHWGGHRRVFRYVDRLAGPVVGLNTVWLMMMILTPFGARLLDSNGGFPIRFTTYAVIQVIALFCMLRINQEVKRRNLLRDDTPDSFRHRDSMPGEVTIIMFLASIPVCFFTEWSFAVWAAIPLVIDVVRRVRIMRGSDPGSEQVL